MRWTPGNRGNIQDLRGRSGGGMGIPLGIGGVLVLLVVWAGFSRPIPPDPTADKYLELATQAHGRDVVTVILADFRGLDTLVEISVVFVALLGVATLLRRGKLW